MLLDRREGERRIEKSIITDDEPREDTYFEFKVLEELFISEFKVVSEEGR